ncbi:helix-turn-helix transcriptional regulator [Pseudonocardia sp. C8]|uniref:helix-turn-helix domain-containing protein n=1 Tax=Pseudonocardia sp. C8 TaxID=2762759 RepID=UPI001642D3C6|nr:helix-turn-helix transcriptional regulator [Pseudonocardia sp. C8]MBC3192895.1 helix-turn-helix transcriptional regulator [Pseudonocardia sp. C8]
MRSDHVWESHAQAFGEYLRARRKLAELSLRDLAARTQVSNAYLSQIERGLHQPSVRVLRSIAEALGLPPDRLLAEAGLRTGADPEPSPADRDGSAPPDVVAAIRADGRLTDEQKTALTAVYRSYVGD